MPLEIACFNEASVKIAVESGADRIELCSHYEHGGLSPELQSVETVLDLCTIPVHVMLRNRPGDFIYNQRDKAAMYLILQQTIAYPIAGIVTGALKEDKSIDASFIRTLRKAVPNHKLVFHRAFDETRDYFEHLRVLIDLGVDSVLSSGGRNHAANHTETLKAMRDFAGDSIELICGGGIRSHNIAEISKKTGIPWMHSAGLINKNDLIPDSNEILKMKTVIRNLLFGS